MTTVFINCIIFKLIKDNWNLTNLTLELYFCFDKLASMLKLLIFKQIERDNDVFEYFKSSN